MAIVQHTSGNLNDIRAYPLADTASRRADDGSVLPESVLNDCHVWWPDTYGDVGFVSSVTVSPNLVTLTIAAYDSTTTEVTVLAAVQMPRPVVPYHSYALEAMQLGVGGWAAPGRIPESMTGVNTWLFSDFSAARLLPRLAQAYPTGGVTSLGKDDSNEVLTGRVRLMAGSNLTVEEGYRYVNGLFTRCIVFGLNEAQLPELYELFAGPCGKRPESGTCDRDPIRTINRVEPDCNGLLYLEVDEASGIISGHLDITGDATGTGVALHTPVDHADLCEPVERFSPMADDICESSLAAEVTEPASSAIPEVLSSSSLAPAIVPYDWSAMSQLRDWSPFDRNDKHAIDWNLATTSQGSGVNPTIESGRLVLRIPDEIDEDFVLANNAVKGRLQQAGDFLELNVRYRIPWADLSNLAIDPNVIHAVEFELSNEHHLVTPGYDGTAVGNRSWRLRVEYQRANFGFGLGVQAAVSARYFTGAAWEVVTGPQTFNFPYPIISSSVVASSSSGESSGLREFLEQYARIRIERLGNRMDESTGGNSSSSMLMTYRHQCTVQFGDITFDQGLDENLGPETEEVQFFSLRMQNHSAASGGPVVRVHFDEVNLLAARLEDQACDEPDFVDDASRVDYALKYDPLTAAWSNDFGTTRALRQVDISQRQLDSLPSSLSRRCGFGAQIRYRAMR
jgi:hypothetical protein